MDPKVVSKLMKESAKYIVSRLVLYDLLFLLSIKTLLWLCRERNRRILSENHYLMTAERARFFLHLSPQSSGKKTFVYY